MGKKKKKKTDDLLMFEDNVSGLNLLYGHLLTSTLDELKEGVFKKEKAKGKSWTNKIINLYRDMVIHSLNINISMYWLQRH